MRNRHHSRAYWHLIGRTVLSVVLAIGLLVLMACDDQEEPLNDQETSTLAAKALPTRTSRPTFTPVPTDTPAPTVTSAMLKP